ncbi:MAG: anthrone oxygenase family protein [Saprospiraceae bacterium]
MKRIILFDSIAVMAGLLFANIYNSLVDAENWCSKIPESIIDLRNYYAVSNPGNFYRLFSPLNQLLALASLVLFWRNGVKVRLFLALALAFALIGEAMTFGYFYPRNEILFAADISTSLDQVVESCHQWQSMNWVRSLVVLVALVFQFSALDKIGSWTKA